MQIKPGYIPGTNAPPEKTPRLGRRERQILLVAVAAILVLGALILVGASQVAKTGTGTGKLIGISSCSGYIYANGYYNCIYKLVNETHNATFCDALPSDGKASCLLGLATNTSNASVCMQISNASSAYMQCIAGLVTNTQNVSYCQSLAQPTSSQCLYNILAKADFNNLAACSKLTNATLSAECTALYYYNLASTTKNPTYCSNLPNTQNPYVLYALSINNSAATGSQFSLGFSISSTLNLTPQGYCNYQLAKLLNQSPLCDGLNSNTAIMVCQAQLIPPNTVNLNPINLNASNVTAACANNAYKNSCAFTYLLNVAVMNDNETACLQLNASNGRYTCLELIALKFFKPQYCTAIDNTSVQSACLNYTSAPAANYTNIFNTTTTTTVP